MTLDEEIDAALDEIRAEQALFMLGKALASPEGRSSLLEAAEALLCWRDSAGAGKMAAA